MSATSGAQGSVVHQVSDCLVARRIRQSGLPGARQNWEVMGRLGRELADRQQDLKVGRQMGLPGIRQSRQEWAGSNTATQAERKCWRAYYRRQSVTELELRRGLNSAMPIAQVYG